MKIIADANIWYYLGQHSELYESVKDKPIAPTYLNLYELSKSENVIIREEFSRSAIQMLFKFQKYLIPERPFVYISKLNQACELSKNDQINIQYLLEFISEFAKGNPVPNKKEFKKKTGEIRESLIKGANIINKEAEKLRRE